MDIMLIFHSPKSKAKAAFFAEVERISTRTCANLRFEASVNNISAYGLLKEVSIHLIRNLA